MGKRKLQVWPFADFEPNGSDRWTRAVDVRLRAGFGVEDCAVYFKCHVLHIRARVAELRQSGKLDEWWPNAARLSH